MLKVWNYGKFEEMEIGQKVLAFRVGSGLSYFGEYATLVRTTKNHLVFVTESGTTLKTAIDNLGKTIGKAGQQGICITSNISSRDDDKNFIKSAITIY